MCYILPPFNTEAPWGGGLHVVWRTLGCAKCVALLWSNVICIGCSGP